MEKKLTKGRDPNGKKRSFQTNWKIFGQDYRNMLAAVPGEKLRVKGYRWVPEKKEPPKKGADFCRCFRV